MNTIEQHPEYKRMMAEVQKSAADAKLQRELDAGERARLRAEQGKYLREQHNEAVAEYEAARLKLHQTVGVVWHSAQEYSRVTGTMPNDFSEGLFNDINLPSLRPAPHAWSNPFSTTRASVMAWFASNGKRWE
jgi:hypothetical protein